MLVFCYHGRKADERQMILSCGNWRCHRVPRA